MGCQTTLQLGIVASPARIYLMAKKALSEKALCENEIGVTTEKYDKNEKATTSEKYDNSGKVMHASEIIVTTAKYDKTEKMDAKSVIK